MRVSEETVNVAVLSANLGGYDTVVPWVDQVVPAGVSVDIHRFDDQNFPPRTKAMLPALQCGIPKMCGWELKPGYDAYLWIDASRGLLRSDTVAWFLERLERHELLLFLHPERSTIREEYEFVKQRMADELTRPVHKQYLVPRYAGEWLDAQYAAVTPAWYLDNKLYASTAFMYRPTLRVKKMLAEWFYFKARYILHDQLALPFVVRDHRISPVELTESVYHCEHLPITRTKGRAA